MTSNVHLRRQLKAFSCAYLVLDKYVLGSATGVRHRTPARSQSHQHEDSRVPVVYNHVRHVCLICQSAPYSFYWFFGFFKPIVRNLPLQILEWHQFHVCNCAGWNQANWLFWDHKGVVCSRLGLRCLHGRVITRLIRCWSTAARESDVNS